MTTVSGNIDNAQVSAVLTADPGENIVWSITGANINHSISLQRAVTPDETSWEDVAGPYSAAASGSFIVPPGPEPQKYRFAAKNLSGQTPTGISKADPAVVTLVGHGLDSGDKVLFRDIGGMVELNGNVYNITVLDPDTFSLQDANDADVDSTGFTTFTSGGEFIAVASYSVADSDRIIAELRGKGGVLLATVFEDAGWVFEGAVAISGAALTSPTLTGADVTGTVKKTPNSLTAASYTAAQVAAFANELCLLNRAGGIDLAMPEATGSGDVYEFAVVAATADAYAFDAFTGFDDDIQGVIVGVDADAEFTWGAAAGDNAVTLGGTDQATGGSVGDYLKFVDIAAGVWLVTGTIHQGGTEATPFSTLS